MHDTLRIERLSKTFPGQRALAEVDLTVDAAEVHALVGQNGSGKSTIIKIMAGYHQPDPGSTATVDGTPLQLGDGQAAAACGIRFVHQDLGLVGTISTVENLALSVGYRTGFGRRIKWAQERRMAEEALASIGAADIDVRAPVASLPPSQRTAVAIARALVGWENGAKLLVLDEPTATLPDDDVQKLFEVIRRVKARGVAILYVSHHLDEVFELADRVTVLRDSRRIATVPVAGLDHEGLIELMVGHRIDRLSSTESTTTAAPILTIQGLQGGTVAKLDLDVREGEVVGLAGITGSGREDVLGLIAGQTRRTGGEVTLGGRQIPNFAPRQALAAGVAFVPADRPARGAVGTMTVRENLTLTDLSRHFVGGRLRRGREVAEVQDWISRLDIKTSSTEAMIGSLSGGNQQKVMFGKALRLSPKVLLLDEPTQGIDVGAKEQIHQLVDKAASEGVATLVASTDTDELVRLCHRIIVFVDGQVSAVLTGASITPEHIEHTQLQTSRKAS
jgi:ribose transport system ATP-binding protein